MKKAYLILIYILLQAIAISCSTSLQQHNQNQVQQARDHWIGESKETLIQSWGPPNNKTTDGSGGVIYSYNRFNGYITWVTNFYINADDIIYNLNAHSE